MDSSQTLVVSNIVFLCLYLINEILAHSKCASNSIIQAIRAVLADIIRGHIQTTVPPAATNV